MCKTKLSVYTRKPIKQEKETKKMSKMEENKIVNKFDKYLEANADYPVFNERNVIREFGKLNKNMCSVDKIVAEDIYWAGQTLIACGIALAQLHLEDRYIENIFDSFEKIMTSDCFDANKNKLTDPVSIKEQRLGKVFNYTGDQLNGAIMSAVNGVGAYMGIMTVSISASLACRRFLDAGLGDKIIDVMNMIIDNNLKVTYGSVMSYDKDILEIEKILLEVENKVDGTVH